MIARIVYPVLCVIALLFNGFRRHKITLAALSMSFVAVILAALGVFGPNAPAVAYAANDLDFPAEVSETTTTTVGRSTISAQQIETMGAGMWEEVILDDVYYAEQPVEPTEEPLVEEAPVELLTVEEAIIEDELEFVPEQTFEITDDYIQQLAADLGAPLDYDAPVAMAGMRYLVENEGFTVDGGAGLLGNAYSESRFDPGADNGSHFGIFQWDYNDRWPKISAYLESIGCARTSRYDSYSLDSESQKQVLVCQLEAALHSSDASYYSETIQFCKTSSSASESADRWRAYYEVCGACQSERMTIAEVTAELYYALYR